MWQENLLLLSNVNIWSKQGLNVTVKPGGLLCVLEGVPVRPPSTRTLFLLAEVRGENQGWEDCHLQKALSDRLIACGGTKMPEGSRCFEPAGTSSSPLNCA